MNRRVTAEGSLMCCYTDAGRLPDSMSGLDGFGQKEEDHYQNQVDREELYAFEPVRLAVVGDLSGDQDRYEYGEDFGGREHQVHGARSDEVAQDDEHGRDEERDLQAAADGYAERELHLVLHRHHDRGTVFGSV